MVRRLLRIGNDVAAADVDCLGKGEGHGLARDGPGEIAIVGHDAVDMAALARGQDRRFRSPGRTLPPSTVPA